MSRLPSVSAKEVVRALKRGGFGERRQSGSHLILAHSDGRTISVPIHKGRDLPRGTLFAIIKQAAFSTEDFLKLLKAKK